MRSMLMRRASLATIGPRATLMQRLRWFSQPFSVVALRAVRLVAQAVALLPEALRQAVQPLGAPLPLDQVLPQEVVRRRLEV